MMKGAEGSAQEGRQWLGLGHGGGGKRGLKACNFERTTLTKLPLATVQQCSSNNNNNKDN